MEHKQIGRQLLEFNKAIFDQTFSSISKLQSQNEIIFFNFLDKLPGVPEEGKRAVSQYITVYKRNMEDVKAMADANFKKANEYFVPADKKQ